MHAGQTVERYVIEELLGEGGMAVVYRVKHTQLGSIHALKVLSAGTKTVRERLMQEGKVQASLRHPNIVAVTDVIDVHGDPGLVMEYVAGPGLDRMLKEKTPNLAEGMRIFLGVVRGIRHAHRKGLIHRDLKPGNVLLEETEDGLIPKVADFGLVKIVAGEGSGTGTTKSGVAMGTPEYMAPEQIRDAATVDHRADMFSLGCILYELVCARPPFKGGDMLQVFNKVATGDYVPPKQLMPELPVAVLEAIDGLLEVDANKRIQDCDALLDLLSADPSAYAGAGSSGMSWGLRSGEEAWSPALNSEGSLSPPTPINRRTSSWVTSQPSMNTPEVAPPRDGLPAASLAPFLALPVLAIALAAGVAMMSKNEAGADPPPPPIEATVTDPPVQPDHTPPVEPPPTEAPPVEPPPVEPPPVEVAPVQPPPVEVKKVKSPIKKIKKVVPPKEPTPPPASKMATVDWTGDASNVWLKAGDKKYPARGAVPAGDYEILAWFNQAEPVAAGKITVKAGQTVTLKCASFIAKCK